jgi:nickel-dependent lactate racemase
VDLELGFGKSRVKLSVDDRRVVCIMHASKAEVAQDEGTLINQAMESPVASPRLRDLARPGQKVVVLTSDVTRPCPTRLMLPAVMAELNDAGVPDQDVTVVFGLGIHRGQTPEERRRLAGDEMYHRLRCIDSDPSDVVRVGTTKRGTPVEVFRTVAEADLRVALANIDPHYFAGYSGGSKSVVPGVCGRATIQANHSLMLEPGASPGQLQGNPVRDDIEEAASLVGVDFILNVILDESKQVVGAVAGHVLEAHRHGCRLADRIFKVPIPERAAVVVASPGGHPKDLNVYQAQKSLDNAAQAVKPGGVIVLVASCAEGFGEAVFEEWIASGAPPAEVVKRLRREFQLGGHKAAAIARVAMECSIFLVSDLSEAMVRRVWMEPFSSAQLAFDRALAEQGPDARVIIMPYAGSTLPAVGGVLQA